MHQRGKLLGLRLPGKNGDASAVAHAECGGNLLVVDKLNTFDFEEHSQTVDVLAGVAAYFVHGRQVHAVGLRDVEGIDVTEAQQHTLVLLGDVLLGLNLL